MRVVLFACAISFAFTAMAQRGTTVVLTGTARNFNNQVEVQDMSETGDLSLPDPQRFFVPDAQGVFQVKFRLAAPNYFRIGRNILYLSPGDSIDMFVDYKDPKLARFSGTHARENEYLRETPFPKGGSFLEAGKLVKRTIDSTVMAVEQAATERTASLRATEGLNTEFRRLETARIRADVLNSFTALETYATYKWKLSKDSADAFHNRFPSLIGAHMDRYNKNFIDASLLKLVVYRDVIDALMQHEKALSPQAKQVKEWMQARDLAQELKRAGSREAKMAFADKIETIGNASYKNALQSTLNKVLLLSNGDMAYDFTALDINQTNTKLSSLKGKLIYIDLWATWCGPCMEEMPAYEKLKESFSNRPDISFISLSIDDDKAAWQKSVQQRKALGLQWLIDRAKLQPYNIMSVPRSVLLDKDFRIVEMSAALPSSKTIAATLSALDK